MLDLWGRDSAGAPAKPGSEVELTKAPSDKLPYGATKRLASFVCRHCGLPVVVKDGVKLDQVSGKCHVCGGLTCPYCAVMGDCTDEGEFMKRVEASERVERLRWSAGG